MKINKEFFTSKKFMIVLSFLGLYLISSGVSLAAFTFLKSEPTSTSTTPTAKGGSRIDLSLPKTEACPINGGMFTKAEKTSWEKKRPITAVIENHIDSRPPSGLSKADVVYEAVAEGGITRFLGVFYCNTEAEEVKIAPVRSARVYFINLASEYGDKPIFMHVGGANNYCKTCPGGVKTSGQVSKDVLALEMLESIGWRVPGGNDFDTVYDMGFPTFWRNLERLDHPVASEHTMMASLDSAYSEAEKRNLGAKDEKGVKWNKDFTSWKFEDDKAASSPTASEISFGFWDNKTDYDVTWKYNQSSNEYLRFNGGKEHKDLEYDKQLSAKNVVIMLAQHKPIVDKEGHAFYKVIGSGDALIFQNGEVVEGTWEKETRESRTIFMDAKGKEINFVRGVTWVELVPEGNKVSY